MAYTTVDDPSEYFQTTLYAGTGSGQSITNTGNSNLKPDWVWVKDRGATNDHKITDSSRLGGGSGPTRTLESNTDAAEYDDQGEGSDATTSFNTDGFTIGTNGNYNTDGNTYVAWQWKCNGGTLETEVAEGAYATNSPANIRQTNTDAGISIITYTGTGAAGQIQHGLGAVPHLILTKQRSNAENWAVYHHENTSAPATDYLLLNATSATADNSNRWNDEAPTTNVFTVGSANEVNTNDRTYVAYVFTEKQGYSRFGNYIGNGTTDGGFVYTGFKPAWLMVKEIVSGGGWGMWDNKRMPFNTSAAIRLLANTNAADDTSNDNRIDFLSNGFKVRTSSGGFNQNATTYIYFAFAESPFVSSEGVPTTAR